MILAELGVIVVLSGSLVSEYLNNIYFQGYVNSLAPILVPVLSVGFGAASASTATVLYFRTRNLRTTHETVLEMKEADEEPRRTGQVKRAVRKTASNDSKIAKTARDGIQSHKLRPMAPGLMSFNREAANTSSTEKKESD